MIKQKSKTFIIFFLLFFSLVNPYIAIVHFYFGKNKLYQTFFAFINYFLAAIYYTPYIILLPRYTLRNYYYLYLYYIYSSKDANKQKHYILIQILFPFLLFFFFYYYYIIFPHHIYISTFPHALKIGPKTSHLYLPRLFRPGTTLQ